jgi:Tfp pilus assembly protein PilN
MIEINLLPGARKQKRSRSNKVDLGALLGNIQSQIRDPYLLSAIAGVVLAVLGVGGMWLYQNRKTSALTDREQIAVQDSTRYSAVIAQRVLAEAQRDSVVRQINIIKAIDGTRFVWPHLLDEVASALPPYTWLKAMNQTSAVMTLSPEVEAGLGEGEPKPGGKSKLAAEADSAMLAASTLSFRIVGQTVDIQALTRFMKQLEASPWIEQVTLAKTEQVTLQPFNRDATEFTLDMKLQKPDSAFIRRVPLSVAVR